MVPLKQVYNVLKREGGRQDSPLGSNHTAVPSVSPVPKLGPVCKEVQYGLDMSRGRTENELVERC